MPSRRYTGRTLAREVVFVIAALAFCSPLYLLVETSLKTTGQAFTSPLPPPAHPQWGNYPEAWRTAGQAGLGTALLSSVIITIGSVLSVIPVGALCAYVLARHRSKLSGVIYLGFVVGIILPYQLAIIPLYVAMRHLGLVGNYLGMIVLNAGLLTPLTVFLYTSFIRSLPQDYEEAAEVDGAGVVRTFVRVIFPLLRPITGTVAVLTGLLTWNEFFLPLIFLSGNRRETLPVALYSFVGEYVGQWNLIFAGVAVSIAPVLAFYLFAQRQLIRGFVAGVKG